MNSVVISDVRQFYHSSEIRPGLWVEVYTRPMFIFSCEGPETRNFLKRFGPIDFEDYEKVSLLSQRKNLWMLLDV